MRNLKNYEGVEMSFIAKKLCHRKLSLKVSALNDQKFLEKYFFENPIGGVLRPSVYSINCENKKS